MSVVATFIGIDLAWKIDRNHSGIAVLAGDERSVRLIGLSEGVTSQSEVIAFVVAHAATNTVLAIDASLVVRNASGQRPCETLVSKTFGRYHAGCHTTNLVSQHARVGMDLVTGLSARGFVHDFDLREAKRRGGRWLFEVYPHPAMVRLFGLERIIKYKKGSIEERRAGLNVLRNHLAALEGLERNLVSQELMTRDLGKLRGQGLKRYEDMLDATFCAFLAWHCWRWGADGNEVFGTLEDGYVVVPKAPQELASA